MRWISFSRAWMPSPLEQANQVIRKYYGADHPTFVLLGNAAKIRDAAAKYGKVTERAARQPGWGSN